MIRIFSFFWRNRCRKIYNIVFLGLAIGMRADFSLIRKGESEGVVIAEFQINKEHLAIKKS